MHAKDQVCKQNDNKISAYKKKHLALWRPVTLNEVQGHNGWETIMKNMFFYLLAKELVSTNKCERIILFLIETFIIF